MGVVNLPPLTVHNIMIIAVTGASGFIGSCLVSRLIGMGHVQLILVDRFDRHDKLPNLKGKLFDTKIDRNLFPNEKLHARPDVIFHIGARTDTTEMNASVFDELNVEYSKRVWHYCTQNAIPLIYASSAATYGNGQWGFDDEQDIAGLKPMNPYGASKQQFDEWVLQQTHTPPHWYGFKFFNVFGPNEYHKGRMASVVFHAFNQIKNTGSIRLFQSHRSDYEHGEQRRDFIYVKDLLDVLIWTWQNTPENGIYNLGTGIARSFNDLARAIFKAMDQPVSITYVPTPEDIRDTYQYFTEAMMVKIQKQGYNADFTPLEDAVKDYVNGYLLKQTYM